MAIRNRRIHHEHLAGAADFLREASEAAHANPEIETRHIERRLIAATSMLATFQEPLDTPNQRLPVRGAWEFIRLSRILNFHSLETPSLLGACKADITFDMENNRGYIVTRGGRFRVAIERVNELSDDRHRKRQEDIDAALKFAELHHRDWWDGLKAACHAMRELADAPESLLEGLDRLTLPELVHRVEVQSTDALRSWFEPVLKEHQQLSPSVGPVNMMRPLDPPKRGELDG